jgi:hypothetical protein
MSGRRSHTRFLVASPWSGVVRMLRDAVVDRSEGDELLAITHTAAVIGEELSLDLMGAGQNVAVKVRVIESRPVIVEGTVRHRVRLALPATALQPAADGFEPAAQDQGEARRPASSPDPIGLMTFRIAEAG